MIDYDLWFAFSKLSNRVKLRLLKYFKTTYNIWNNVIKKRNVNLLNNKILFSLEKAWNINKIENIKKNILQNDINVVNFNDKVYPKKLKYYDDAPSVLFYKGNIEKLNEDKNKSIAIVGSRRCTSYGKNVTQIITKELIKYNINIISGMARGIDGCAQNTCVKNNGYTCAVLGCGLDIIYPKQHKILYNNILKNGCIISEFLPGTKPYSYNFPMRNRIISALSDLVLVVEANDKSGSLITANLALEQGKDVVAVPGSIFSSQSKGTNKLIKDGAFPFVNFEEFFSLIGEEYICKCENKQKIYNLNTLEEKIYNIITDNPIHIDDIIRKSKVDIKQLYEVLFELQFKNLIICISGNYYVKLIKSI